MIIRKIKIKKIKSFDKILSKCEKDKEYREAVVFLFFFSCENNEQSELRSYTLEKPETRLIIITKFSDQTTNC